MANTCCGCGERLVTNDASDVYCQRYAADLMIRLGEGLGRAERKDEHGTGAVPVPSHTATGCEMDAGDLHLQHIRPLNGYELVLLKMFLGRGNQTFNVVYCGGVVNLRNKDINVIPQFFLGEDIGEAWPR